MTILTVLKVRHSFFVAIYSNEHSDENICTYDYIVNGKPHTFFSGPRFFEIIVAVEKLSQLFTLFKLRRF